jgi:hypothetical protein
MDKIPQMTEKKKKLDMHVQTATKILSEIKRRSIDKLQDFEDELMSAGRFTGQNRIEVMNYLKTESDKQEVFNDKMRLIMIGVMCGNEIGEIRQMIEVVKEVHRDRYDEELVESLIKRRT